jgi:Ankyrin repeats (3 copies)
MRSLPIFAITGVRGRCGFAHPPTWNSWLEALKLLVSYGASVHEPVHGRSISTCLIVRGDRQPKLLEFLSLLKEENYTEFGCVYRPRGFSAVYNAVIARGESRSCLKLLSQTGVDLSSALDDGRSALHLAAQSAFDVETLEYLCNNGCNNDVNRQDQWGWTPLHYTLLSAALGTCPKRFAKTRYLLWRGADPSIKADRPLPFLKKDLLPQEPFNSAVLADSLGSTILDEYVDVLVAAGHPRPCGMDLDFFFDAVE